MRRTIKVHLWEAPREVGTLHYNQDGSRESATFEYDPGWLRAPDRFAIDPGLPLRPGPQFHRRVEQGSVFHPAFADTEPDGWGRMVINRDHAKRRRAARATGLDVPPILGGLDYLLEVDDLTRIGALRFEDEEQIFCRAVEPGGRSIPPLIELPHLLAASRAVELHEETAADLQYLRGRATSLGGLRPKCTVVDEDGQLSIGKFPSTNDERAVTRGEVLALHLASSAGINAAQARLAISDGTPVAVIRRFDRTATGRLLYVSAATLLGVERGEPGEHTYREIVDAIRQHGVAVQADTEELWRRIAFSILITNVDDHLHNHGFLHVHSQQWRLAPAFDINPFPDRLRELKTWITEDTGPESSIEALMSAVPYFRIPIVRARAILGEVESAVATWRTTGESLGMTGRELEQFAEAFEHVERDAARAAAL